MAEARPIVRRSPLCVSLLVQLLIDDGRHVRFRAHGGSMHPTIQDGDLVTVAPAVGPLVPGDVILYRSERGVIAHRLVDVGGTRRDPRFVCRGDSAPFADAPVSRRVVLGRVVAVDHAGRVRAPRREAWTRVVRPLRTVARALAQPLVHAALAMHANGRTLAGRVGRRFAPGTAVAA